MAAPPNTAAVRRWSIEPLPTNPNNTLILQVMVTRWRERGVADTETAGEGRRLPDEARILSVKTRKASDAPPLTRTRLFADRNDGGDGLMLVVTGSIFALLNPGQGNFVAEPEVADMQQRTRLAADTLYKDLVMVGSGSYSRQEPDRASYFFAPVMPHRQGRLQDDPPACSAPTRSRCWCRPQLRQAPSPPRCRRTRPS